MRRSSSSSWVVLCGDLLSQFDLAAVQVLLGQLAHGFHEERSRTEGRFADRECQDVGRRSGCPALVEQLGQRVADHEAGEHLGRVVARAALTIVTGEPEHEVARRVGHPAQESRLWVSDLHEPRVVEAFGG